MRTAALVVLFGALATRSARADRVAQAHHIFYDSCARCHSAESLRPKTSSMPEPPPAALVETKSSHGRKSQPDQLRTWMEHPQSVVPDSVCEANRLDSVQRELVMSFLRKKTNPLERLRVMARVPEQHNGIAAAPEPVKPKLGQGDHR